MKTITIILTLIALNASSQCFNLPNDAMACPGGLTLTAYGAMSYTWVTSGSNRMERPFDGKSTFFVNPTGNTTVTVCAENKACRECKAIKITYVAKCPIVGIEELTIDPSTKTEYFDLYGNPTEKTTGVMLIEKTGRVYKKVLYLF